LLTFSSPYAVEQAQVVNDQLEDMGIGDSPRVLVLNKLDLVVDSPDEPLNLEVLEHIDVSMFKRVVTTSATKGWGMADLREAIEAQVSVGGQEEALIPQAD
jgi:50S ribosomal subunit-associated GTPase HflX